MAWTYQLGAANLADNRLTQVVRFASDTAPARNFAQAFTVSDLDTLKRQIQQTLDDALRNDALLVSLSAGLPDLTVSPAVLSADDAAVSAFAQLWRRVLSVTASVNAGNAKPADLTAATADMKAAYAKASATLQPRLDDIMRSPF